MAAEGDALRRVRPGLRPDPQRGHEDAPEGLQGEDVLARLAGPGAGQRGDRDDDPGGDVGEQFRHPRLGAGELVGGTGVVGLDSPEVAEGTDGRVRGHRGERCGVAHDGSTTGWSYDKLGNETAAADNTPRTGETWTDHSQLSGITAGGTTYDLVHAGATNAERTKLGSTWFHHTALGLASTMPRPLRVMGAVLVAPHHVLEQLLHTQPKLTPSRYSPARKTRVPLTSDVAGLNGEMP
ncbi:hypothetical protein [Streptomyces sp. NPDC096105]|uniref:hypothetical protein n=1 Tax=Streptomyces sp. NPDC096105 TaxID=3366074 RepID=UPI00380EEC2C